MLDTWNGETAILFSLEKLVFTFFAFSERHVIVELTANRVIAQEWAEQKTFGKSERSESKFVCLSSWVAFELRKKNRKISNLIVRQQNAAKKRENEKKIFFGISTLYSIKANCAAAFSKKKWWRNKLNFFFHIFFSLLVFFLLFFMIIFFVVVLLLL